MHKLAQLELCGSFKLQMHRVIAISISKNVRCQLPGGSHRILFGREEPCEYSLGYCSLSQIYSCIVLYLVSSFYDCTECFVVI